MGSEVLLYQIPKNVGRASEVGRGQMIEMIGKKTKNKTVDLTEKFTCSQ